MSENIPTGATPIGLPPFSAWLASNIPAVYDNTMSYYEELTSLIKYLETVVLPAVNENSESVTELSRLYAELKEFVDTYFENLDVQEEINNKLDQMVEDGTLQEIITTYIQSNVAWVFDTVADMKVATNLVNGSYARTLGYHSVDDGGAATYYIDETGTADEGAIIAIGSTLKAHLVHIGKITPEMFGAYGDGVHDDVTPIRKALDFLYSTDSDVNTWQMSGTLYFNAKTYLVDGPIIEVDYPSRVTRISLKGDGTRTAIVAGENCTRMFDNQNKIGFSNFEDIYFVGNDSTFLYTSESQPQRLRFIRCTFRNFHTVANVQGTVDNSEFVYDQCAIQGCGTTLSPCELFIFNNSQAVNWRFYATDIESFTGVCFHFIQGTNIHMYQGSIIALEGSVIYSFDGANQNTFGPGNFPTIALYGVRYELRNSQLLVADGFQGRISIEHIYCGMGGGNISDASDTIKIIDGVPKMTFISCYNLNNYKLNLQINRYLSPSETNAGYLKFINCEYDVVKAMVDRSSITASSAGYYRMAPTVLYNGQPLEGLTVQNLAKYTGQIMSKNITILTNYDSTSSPAGVKTNLPRAGFITSITLESVYTTSFGSTSTLTAEVYNASDQLIASGNVTIQSRSKATIQVNAPVTDGWYILLKNSSPDATWYVPHILYAEYLS